MFKSMDFHFGIDYKMSDGQSCGFRGVFVSQPEHPKDGGLLLGSSAVVAACCSYLLQLVAGANDYI